MQVLTSLLAVLVAARLLGHLATRYGQPAIVGEMLAGVLLGPSVFGWVEPNAALSGIASLAIFLVVLSAGLEMRLRDIVTALRGGGLLVALLGFVLPFGAGVAIALAFGLDVMRTVFLGLCISITALPVAVKMLEDFGMLATPIGHLAVSTAVINDVLALFVLGVLLALPEQTTWSAVAAAGSTVTLKLLALAATIVALNAGLHLLERRGVNIAAVPERIVAVLGPEALFGVVILFVMLVGTVSEALGFHFVIGAFFGALLLDQRHFVASRYDDLRRTLASVTGGFLAPVFFAYIGLEFALDSLDDVPFVVVVLLAAVASKVLAGWWGGRRAGMTHREALALGCVLNGRGAMELVVASIAYERGFIGIELFSVLVLMGLVTTLVTPLAFNAVVPAARREAYRAGGRL